MKNIRITNNQIEILTIIEAFRYIPLKIIRTIIKQKNIYIHRQAIERVIRNLEKKKLINSFYYGNNWKVVYLTKLGGKLLADCKGVDVNNISIPNQGKKVKFATLEHSVKIGEIYQQFTSTLEQSSNAKLVKWVGDQRAVYLYEFRSDRTGRTVKRILSPDSYFETLKDGTVKNYFLEYDTGSMDFEQLAKKFMRYFEYYVYGDWKIKFITYPTILFLSDRSEKRLQNLQIPPENSLEKALQSRGIFSQSQNLIWRSIGLSENLRSITSNEIESFLTIPIWFNQLKESRIKNLLRQY